MEEWRSIRVRCVEENRVGGRFLYNALSKFKKSKSKKVNLKMKRIKL